MSPGVFGYCGKATPAVPIAP